LEDDNDLDKYGDEEMLDQIINNTKAPAYQLQVTILKIRSILNPYVSKMIHLMSKKLLWIMFKLNSEKYILHSNFTKVVYPHQL
jgi:hypothetical protein